MTILAFKQTKEADAEKWHKHFAVESNKIAWDLASRDRTEEQDHEMLAAAHGSLFHWSIIGIELNMMRAKMIIAEVHALLGMGETAFMYAREVHTYYTSTKCPDWELALTHAIYAHAAFESGDYCIHERACKEALTAMEAIEDPGDRDMVLQTFGRVPAPAES